MSALVLYATTTRRTESAAQEIRAQLSKHTPTSLAAVDSWDFDKTCDYRLIIAGSPTTGQGQLHRHWRSAQSAVEVLCLNHLSVAVFALGDQKYHSGTFGNALWLLHELWQTTGAQSTGQTRCIDYQTDRVPHLHDKQLLPGLLLDQISQRRFTPQRIEAWIAQLMDQEDLKS